VRITRAFSQFFYESSGIREEILRRGTYAAFCLSLSTGPSHACFCSAFLYLNFFCEYAVLLCAPQGCLVRCLQVFLPILFLHPPSDSLSYPDAIQSTSSDRDSLRSPTLRYPLIVFPRSQAPLYLLHPRSMLHLLPPCARSCRSPFSRAASFAAANKYSGFHVQSMNARLPFKLTDLWDIIRYSH
jgi:hypothetical protein